MRRRQALLGIAFLAVLVPASALASAPALTQQNIAKIGVSLEVPAGWV
jgi:hypothetical protein